MWMACATIDPKEMEVWYGIKHGARCDSMHVLVLSSWGVQGNGNMIIRLYISQSSIYYKLHNTKYILKM